MKKLKFLSFFLSLLISCGDIFNPSYDDPVKEFFQKYTDSAAIEISEYTSSIGKSASGTDCFESNGDKSIFFFLRNPQGYNLKFSYTFDHPEIASTFSDYESLGYVSFVLSNAKLDLTLVFSKEFLNKIEMGEVQVKDSDGNPTGEIIKDISGTINIYEAETLRAFQPYHVSVIANSAPPRIRGGMFQRDRKKSEDDAAGTRTSRYVVCLNVKNFSDTVHEADTKYIYFNSECYALTFSSESVSVSYCGDGSDSNGTLSATAPANLWNLDDSDSGFLAATGYLPLYYTLNICPEETTETVTCTVSIRDDYGFAATSVVSNQADQLQPPIIEELPSGEYYADDETGIYYLTLYHDRSTWHIEENEDGTKTTVPGQPASGAPTIVYDVYNTTNPSTPVVSGAEVSPVKVPVQKGRYYVRAWAYYSGLIDSVEATEYKDGSAISSSNYFKVYRSVNYYVSVGGDDDKNNGSKNSPYRSVQKCIDDAKTEASFYGAVSTGYIINLQSDITATGSETGDDFINFSGITGGIKYILNGNGHTIDAAVPSTENRRVVLTNSNTDVTLNDVTLTGGYAPGDGIQGVGICFTGGKVTLNNVEITGMTGYQCAVAAYSNGGLVFNSGSIHDNTAVGGISAIGILGPVTLGSENGSVSIYNNTDNSASAPCAVKVNGAGTLNIYNASIYDNKDSSDNHRDLYLVSGKVINVLGSLSGCKIGVYSEAVPTVSEPVTITQDYSIYNSVLPGTVFYGNKNGAIWNDEETEVILEVSGGATINPLDTKIEFSLKDAESNGNEVSGFYVGKAKTIYAVPKITVDGEEIDFNTVKTKFSWKLALKCSGTTITTSSTNSLSVPATGMYEDTYTLSVRATYNGISYNAEFIVVGLKDFVYADSPAAGTYSVKSAESIKTIKTLCENSSNGLADYTFELESNITVTGEECCIGTVEKPFCGKFDGKKHTVTYNSVAPSGGYGGLIAVAGNGAVISNVITAGSLSEGTKPESEIGKLGGIVGYAYAPGGSVKIQNCTSNVTISVSTMSSWAAGGILGYSKVGDLLIDCCVNNGHVGDNTLYAGGILGFFDSTEAREKYTIRNCGNNAQIKGTGESSSNKAYYAAILGFNTNTSGSLPSDESSIKNCFNTVDIPSISYSIGYYGDIISYYCGTGGSGITFSNYVGVTYYFYREYSNGQANKSFCYRRNSSSGYYWNYRFSGTTVNSNVTVGSHEATNDIITLLNYWVEDNDSSIYKSWTTNTNGVPVLNFED